MNLLKSGIGCYEVRRLRIHSVGKGRSERGVGNSRNEQNVFRPHLIYPILKSFVIIDIARYTNHLKTAAGTQSEVPKIFVMDIFGRPEATGDRHAEAVRDRHRWY